MLQKRWYWPVTDNCVQTPLRANAADLRGHDLWDFTNGRPLAAWDGSAWYRSGSSAHDGEPDDVLIEHLGIPVYSERLRITLSEAGISGIQHLPVRLFRSDGAEIHGYAIANILNLVPALDLMTSDYTVFGDDRPDRKGQVRALRRPVLKASLVAGLDVFRLEEYELFVCVSELFKTVFELGHFTGYSFRQLEIS
jgi:hypothetical protein